MMLSITYLLLHYVPCASYLVVYPGEGVRVPRGAGVWPVRHPGIVPVRWIAR
ncbi:hypothetical protein [Frankia sp. CcWB2]